MAASSSADITLNTDFAKYTKLISKVEEAQKGKIKEKAIVKLILNSEFSKKIVELIVKLEKKTFSVKAGQTSVQHTDFRIQFFFTEGVLKVKILPYSSNFELTKEKTLVEEKSEVEWIKIEDGLIGIIQKSYEFHKKDKEGNLIFRGFQWNIISSSHSKTDFSAIRMIFEETIKRANEKIARSMAVALGYADFLEVDIL